MTWNQLMQIFQKFAFHKNTKILSSYISFFLKSERSNDSDLMIHFYHKKQYQ